MGGANGQPGSMSSSVSLEERVPADHPLRAIRRITDRAFEHAGASARRTSIMVVHRFRPGHCCARCCDARSIALVTVVALLFGARIVARETFPAQGSTPLATVAIDLFHNRVYVPVEVNGRGPFEMVLDTGAGVSGLSEATAHAVGLHTSGDAQLTGNGESRLKVTMAKNVTLQLGPAQIPEKQVAIIAFRELESHEGRTIDGVLGVDLFRRFIVVIDYGAKTLALYTPQGFSYHGDGVAVPLHIGRAALFDAHLDVDGEGPVDCRLAVDSGTYSALRLYRPFVRKHHLPVANTQVVDSFGFGLGGEFPEKLGRVGALRIGGVTLNQPPVSFSDADGGATSAAAYDGTIGGEILSRFTVIFDYPHQQMILEPNPLFSEPFPADHSGVVVGVNDSGAITVLHVLDHTPAQDAGIRQGDVIIGVNTEDASGLGVEGIRRLFLRSANYRIRLLRGGQTLEVVLKATRPLY